MHALAPAPDPDDAAPPTEISDLDAVSRVQRGDREMFEVIVRRYNPQLYRVGMAYLRNHAQTEDCMQNAYLKAFLHLGRFRGGSSFSTWLTRILINECLMLLRSGKRAFMENIDDLKTETQLESFAVPPSESLNGQDLRAVLEETLQTLPRQHRAVYLMREVQRLSTEETARCLGISAANVKVSLHRAREGLKAGLMRSAAGIELFEYAAPFCDPMTARVMALVRGLAAGSASAGKRPRREGRDQAAGGIVREVR